MPDRVWVLYRHYSPYRLRHPENDYPIIGVFATSEDAKRGVERYVPHANPRPPRADEIVWTEGGLGTLPSEAWPHNPESPHSYRIKEYPVG